MPDLLTETLIPFAAGIRSLPGRPHISTGYRYAYRGIRGVRLETIVVGGRRWTSLEALRRFVVAVTAAADRLPLANPVEQPKWDEQRIESELDAEGL